MLLTLAEERKVVEFYFANDKSPTRAARAFNTWAQNNNSHTVVSEKNVRDALKRFQSDKVRGSRQRASVLKDENVAVNIISSIYQQPGKSIRKCAVENQLSVGTTHKFVRDVLGLHAYHLTVVQSLSEYDKVLRFDACHRLLDVLTDDKVIIYSDEATFRLDGMVNRWNFCVWDYEKPEDFFVQQNQGAPSVTVWAALSKSHLFGPYFFPSTVTGDMYRAVLTEFFFPNLHEQCGTTEHIWFQQDGAPAHTATETKHLLADQFQDRIVSRGFLHEWPPRSPDLTPCDFYLWGVVKDVVYRNGHFTRLSDLENAVNDAFNMMRHSKIEDVRRAALSVRGRLQECIAVAGSQLAHR